MTIQGLPTGMTYEVEETPVVGFSTTVNQQSGTGLRSRVASAEAVTIAFTNTRLTSGENEMLTVAKKLVSGLATDAQKQFDFKVTLSDTTISGTFGGMTFENGVAQFKLKGGESIQASGLPIGIEYTVEELKAEGFSTSYTDETGAVTNELVRKGMIEQGKPQTTTYTNTRDTGSLKISKTVSGGGGDQEVFTFVVSIPNLADGRYGDMTFVGGLAEVQLKHGEFAVATGLPKTAVYAVEEAEYADYAPVVKRFDGVIADGEALAEFVNVFIAVDLPETGDTSSLLLWTLLALTASGLAFVLRKKRI